MISTQTVTAGRGSAWFTEGFRYFSNSPGAWIGVVLLLLALLIVCSVLPFASILLQLFMPVVAAGLLTGCRDIDRGGKLRLNHLFAGFNQNTANLVLLGILYLLGQLVILVAVIILGLVMIGNLDVLMQALEGDTALFAEHYLDILLAMLVALMLYVPLLMASWFAPALIVFQGQGTINAMQYSFNGCLKNIMPFLVYGLIGLVLMIIATIPLMLGWFILVPVIIASIYLGYKDIYTGADRQTA